MNRVIIAGSRTLPVCHYAIDRVQRLLEKLEGPIELVTGCAKGADQIAYEFRDKYPIKEFPANWKEFGKGAGHIRNKEMAMYATHLILFWDGKSRGSANMLENAREHNLKIKTITFEKVRNRSS